TLRGGLADDDVATSLAGRLLGVIDVPEQSVRVPRCEVVELGACSAVAGDRNTFGRTFNVRERSLRRAESHHAARQVSLVEMHDESGVRNRPGVTDVQSEPA